MIQPVEIVQRDAAQPPDAPYCWRLPRNDAGCTSLGHAPTVGLPCPECPRPTFTALVSVGGARGAQIAHARGPVVVSATPGRSVLVSVTDPETGRTADLFMDPLYAESIAGQIRTAAVALLFSAKS